MSRWFTRYGFDHVGERLVSGAYLTDERDVALIAGAGVDRILNLAEDREYRPGEREAVETALLVAGIEEQRLSLTDFGALPGGALDAAVETVIGWLAADHTVYVHCRAGMQRSGAVAAAVVALREDVDIETALRRVRSRRALVQPLPHQHADLVRWWELRQRR